MQDGCADIREMVSEIADYIKGTQATHFENHRLDEVIALGSRVLVLSDGGLVLECRPHELAGKADEEKSPVVGICQRGRD